MNAFVTGGTGFIGSHLVDQLISHPDYDQILCLVRNKEKWIEGKNYIKVSGDLHSIKPIEEALADTDVIFHLAAIVKAPSEREFLHANVEATENILRLAKKNGIKKVVLLSSLAAAGPSNGTPKDETSPMEPVSMYGRSKMAMEEMVHKVAGKDMTVTILRPPAVYGPREEQIFTLFKMMKNGLAPIVGDGNHPEVSLIYVMDLIQAILKAAEQNEPGIRTYFVSGDRIANWNEIKDIVSTVLGKKSFSLKLKPGLVKGIAGFIETSASFFGIYPVINREKANELILEWTCTHDKAKKELHYNPQFSLEEGLSRTLRWYKKHNWL